MSAASPAHDLRQALSEAGIALRRLTRGEHRAACPECARTQPRRHDDALALKIDDRGATWVCHRCCWTGGARTDAAEPRRTFRSAAKPPPEPPPAAAPDLEAERRRELAQEVWRQSTTVAACPPAVRYLAARGLPTDYRGDVNGNIRAHPACPYGRGTAPALIAPVNCCRTGLVVAVWRVLLRPDGTKIERLGLGPTKGNAARLFWPEGDEIAVAEGVEDALAFRELTGIATWAAFSAGNMEELVLPAFVRRVLLMGRLNGVTDLSGFAG
jgi:putative DNA primase/helicase